MAPPLLLLFVDGLPYADRAAVVPTDWQVVPMVPGLGYSVNIKAELFAGSTAADLGWFCEWNPGEARPRLQRALARAASLVSGSEHLDWLAHRVLERIIGERLFNVPLECLHGLHRTGHAAYDQSFHGDTIFSTTAIELVEGEHDRVVADGAHQRLAAGTQRVFVPLVQLDGDTHRSGLGGAPRRARLTALRTEVAELWAAAQDANPEVTAVLVSDHGLADVAEPVELDLRQALGRLPRGRRALYTIEATLARLWCDDPTVVASVRRDLDRVPGGRVLDAEERARWHLDDRRFGDLIFLLDEGRCFVPNTMTKRTVPVAMHGYDPALESQWGVAAASRPLFDGPQRPLDVHAALRRCA